MQLLGNTISLILFCMTTNMAQLIQDLENKNKHTYRLFSNFHERQRRTSLHKSKVQPGQRLQTVVDESIPFPCSVKNGRSKSKPTSVHMLKPGDIDVVGSIGDSLTAGVGTLTTNILTIFQQHRGVSYIIVCLIVNYKEKSYEKDPIIDSCFGLVESGYFYKTGVLDLPLHVPGGQKTWREYMTLPNIIKEFNPNLIGYSSASSQSTDPRSQFNAAESGAASADLPHMTKEIIKRIKNDRRVNITSDWKHISISMGANDFCSRSCISKDPYAAMERHRLDLIESLRLLRDNLPRTYVNFIPPPNVLLVNQLDKGGIVCNLALKIECRCVIRKQSLSFAPALADIMEKWAEIDVNVSMYDEFNRNDFTVEVHPIFQKFPMPTMANGDVDYSYFAVDCFHFSQKAHAILAVLAWNGLLSCENGKWDFDDIFYEKMKCPSEKNPYIITKRNKPSCQ